MAQDVCAICSRRRQPHSEVHLLLQLLAGTPLNLTIAVRAYIYMYIYTQEDEWGGWRANETCWVDSCPRFALAAIC